MYADVATEFDYNRASLADLRIRFNAASHTDPDYAQVFHEIFPHDQYSTRGDKVTAHSKWTTKNEDGEAVGISGIYALNAMPGSYWLDYFGVRSAFRGAGYGKHMLDHIMQIADRKEAQTINLWTTDADLKTKCLERFYQRNGFEKIDCGALTFNASDVSVFSRTLRGHKSLALHEMRIDDWLH